MLPMLNRKSTNLLYHCILDTNTPCDQSGAYVFSAANTVANDYTSRPLKPAELQVLRAQYEKEGEYVSLQTKFNYAWVHPPIHTHTQP